MWPFSTSKKCHDFTFKPSLQCQEAAYSAARGFLVQFPGTNDRSNSRISPMYGYAIMQLIFFERELYFFFVFSSTVLLSVCPPRGSIPLDNRDNSFSRSRSSSVTSIDKDVREAITSFYFSQALVRKTDSSVSPALWVGTSLGAVLSISVNFPPPGEQRLQQPVIVSPSGKFVFIHANRFFLSLLYFINKT